MHGRADDDRIGLERLSEGQRRRVAEHLPLVRLTLARCFPRGRAWGERRDLVQEGCIALAEAVRNHDPCRHGAFGPYAMARVHFAMSRYLCESTALVRVPMTTQRRARARGDDRHDPRCAPRLVRCGSIPRSQPSRRERPAAPGRPTVGDMMRQRFLRAMERVIDQMAGRARAPGTRELLARCAAERWMVPEPAARTSIRELARALACPPSRVVHCEERMRRRMAAALRADATFAELVRQARRSAEGWDQALKAEQT
jgi:hypothetical protein